MAERRTKGRFTIQFNLSDPQQASAAELLERQGRHKAQFLTNAIRNYMGGAAEQSGAAIPPDLEDRVRELVDRYMMAGRTSPTDDDQRNDGLAKTAETGTGIDYSAVQDTLLAFDSGIA